MPSPRRIVAVFAALVLAGWAVTAAGQAPGGAAPERPAGVEVEIDRAAGGPPVVGTYTGSIVRLKSEYGTLDLNVRSVRTLDLSAVDDRIAASVTLTDKSHLYGPLLTETFPVVIDGRPQEIPAREVSRIQFRHPKDTSLAAALIGLLTLTLLEIVLGVDNVIFLAIVASKLPREQQRAARRIGLGAALGTRILLLLALTWLLGLTKPVLTLPNLPLFETAEARGVSWRDIILILGGIFLIGKSTLELHHKVEESRGAAHPDGGPAKPRKPVGFWRVIAEIAVIDIIFSLDSVITAAGVVDERWVMITAVILAVGIMLVAAEPIARFVDNRPTFKVLALSFLILIGVLLVAEGLGQHMNKGYIYFAMAFAVAVEAVNMRLRPGHGEAKEVPKGEPGA